MFGRNETSTPELELQPDAWYRAEVDGVLQNLRGRDVRRLGARVLGLRPMPEADPPAGVGIGRSPDGQEMFWDHRSPQRHYVRGAGGLLEPTFSQERPREGERFTVSAKDPAWVRANEAAGQPKPDPNPLHIRGREQYDEITAALSRGSA